MTVPSTLTRSGPYIANGVQTTWDYDFKTLAAEDIQVIITDLFGAEVVEDFLNYTVTNVGVVGGGEIIHDVAPPAGYKVTYLLAPTIEQQQKYRDQGAYDPARVEFGFDRIVTILQSFYEQLQRAVKVDVSSGITPENYLGAAQVAAAQSVAAKDAAETAEDNSAASAVDSAASAASVSAQVAAVTYLWCGTSGGSANAQTLTPNPAITAYAAGQKFRFLAGFSNSAAAVTVNVSGLGVKTILKRTNGISTSGLAAGDISVGDICEIEYDGTQFQLLNSYPFGESITAVVAAAALPLSNTPGDFVTVSGNTGITSVTMAQGQRRVVRFTGTPLITNGASLVLPNAQNLQIAVGDIITFRRVGAVVYVQDYQPVTGYRFLIGSADPIVCGGRLTLTSDNPVTTADVVGATNIYFTPATGNKISLHTGAEWRMMTFTQLTLALAGLTVARPYDVFLNYNGGTPVLSLLAWASDTARATALVLQDGVLVKTGASTERYLGTFYTTAANTTEDSVANRYLYNYYNRVERGQVRKESTVSWTYSTAAYRQTNAAAANQLNFVVGVAEDIVKATASSCWSTGDATNRICYTGIGLDSTTVNSADVTDGSSSYNAASTYTSPKAHFNKIVPIGKHSLVWLEYGGGASVQTWRGINAPQQSGIFGSVMA